MSHTLLCQYTKLSLSSIPQLEARSLNGEERRGSAGVMRLIYSELCTLAYFV